MSSLTEFDHLRITLKEILEATSNFSDENLIGRGKSASVYKGQLLQSKEQIDVAVRRLDSNFAGGDVEFFSEISILSCLEHENLNSIIGFCDENGEKIIVKKHELNASLDKHLSSTTFTWMQRLHICLGAANALRYLHKQEGRNYGVIHRNIKSSKILLDENWNAKISGFEHSLVNPARRSNRLLLTPTPETSGYLDPVSIQTGSVTYKSDSYSFGIVLFEVLCGRLCVIEDNDDQRRLLAPLVKLHYDERKLDEIIPVNLRNQMSQKSLSVFSETAYYCLKEQRTQRPDMDQIARKLYKAIEFQQKHENPVEPPLPAVRTWSNHVKENFKYLKIPLEDIKLATHNFEQCIGEGGYGKVYKGELDCYDNKKQNVDQDIVLKTRKTVAIKQISSRQDSEGEETFFTEIEMLTGCDHPNVVSLIGFCDEGENRILVYEYASNGSLAAYLESIDKMTNLTWKERLQMCLNIAQGLNYLHTKDIQRIIHRDIKSDNILLDENWIPKIADFGLSKFSPMHQEVSYLKTNVVGTDLYRDPEYVSTYTLRKESDIYSFGVVLFEIMCGRSAFDNIYYDNNDEGLPSVVRRHYNEKTLKKIIDPKVMEETDENVFTLNKGPNEESLNTFLKIAWQCLAETQKKRPTMEVVIQELQKALDFQVNHVDVLKISKSRILLATRDFSKSSVIGRGGYGDVYKAEFVHADTRKIVAVKRHLANRAGQGEREFLAELEILFEYKHENVIGLVGYYNDLEEKIIVYEYASYGSLDRFLHRVDLTWSRRIKICIDVASGLNFLHAGVSGEEMVIHRDIKSSNILLDAHWKAKISDFGLSMITPINQHMNYIICNPVGTVGYVDPYYVKTGYLTKECDIYSLGVVLLEIMCGRLAIIFKNSEFWFLEPEFKRSFEEGKVDHIVFEGIKAKIAPASLILFSKIVYNCLHDDRKQRPTTDQVVLQLKETLEIQEDYDTWEPRLPEDYKKLIEMSNISNIEELPEKKKISIYNMLRNGILLQNNKVWFSLSNDGLRNEMISATTFSLENLKSCKWSFLQSSRFLTVAEMLDISDMKIEVKITSQYLSSDVIYGAYFVFKFCDPRKQSNKPVYVNLKYKLGSKILHSHFATWRDDEWMMVQLDTFLNHKTTDFEVLLDSFSQNCCGSCSIFVEGIEFRAIDNVKHGELKHLKRVQEVINSNTETEELFSPMKVSGTKSHMLPAKMVLYDHSNVKWFKWTSLANSRFIEVAELLAHQVFRIKCKVESQSLSSDTEYACYLVYKLSQECHGLQCPVKVRDVVLKENKETKVVYFKSFNSITLHDIGEVPNQREDGLMEVIVWEFNSSNKHNEDHVLMNLKLRCYEGTMFGLIVYGIEFRPK